MKNTLPDVTVHMVVKNEDQWLWFALQSVLPYVKQIFLTDTGSTDHTLSIIKEINSPKIKFTQTIVSHPSELTQVRQHQLEQTTTNWIWLVDADEIYPRKTVQEIIRAINSQKYEGIVVRRYDLLGDVYHRQRETVGTYHLFGQSGHLVTRLLNKKKIPGLHLKGDYPLEGYYDSANQSIRSRNVQKYYITQNYLYHAMYLKRSSQGGNLKHVFNRQKYKIEKGIPINNQLPEVFNLPRPSIVPDPLQKRSFIYETLATFITPIKNLKRRLL